jgi:hypothetical protein
MVLTILHDDIETEVSPVDSVRLDRYVISPEKHMIILGCKRGRVPSFVGLGGTGMKDLYKAIMQEWNVFVGDSVRIVTVEHNETMDIKSETDLYRLMNLITLAKGIEEANDYVMG